MATTQAGGPASVRCLVEPISDAAARFTAVVEVRLLGLLRPLTPLVAWLLQRRTPSDLRRLKQILEA
jgi:hypothetical protein